MASTSTPPCRCGPFPLPLGLGLLCSLGLSAALLSACKNEPASQTVQVAVELPGSNCANGGQRIQIQGTPASASYVCNGSPGVAGSSATVTVADEPVGVHCPAGGKAITTTSGSSSPVTSYVCNGQGGANGQSAVATAEPAGANCVAGGVRVQVGNGAPSYVCNGAAGAPGASVSVSAAGNACPNGGVALQVGTSAPAFVCNGADGKPGTSVTMTAEPPGTHCVAGGTRLDAGAATAYVCNGINGQNGADGQSVQLSAEPAGANCAAGGVKLQVGSGTPTYVCNGAAGANGQSVGMTPELPGPNCTYGGQKLQVGGGAVSYVCNGAPGSQGAQGASVTTAPEPAGANCAAGGVKLQVGSAAATYVCSGAAGANGQSVSMTPEPAGANCAAGGVKLQVGSGSATYVCNGAAGANGSNGQSVTVTSEPAGSNCANGGVKLQVGSNTPSYVCNGAPGAAGANGESVTVTSEPAGENCQSGGVKLQVGSGPVSYVCTGAKGADGASGQSVTVTDEPSGANCAHGGVRLQVGSGPVSYVCTGATGAAGQSVTVTEEPAGANCSYGGSKLQVGAGAATYVCNGAPGANGTNGSDGQSVTLTTEPPGSNCAAGGVKLQVGSGPASYVCSGAAGSAQSVTVTVEPPGANCAAGGSKLQVGNGTPSYVCNGERLIWASVDGDAQAQANHGYICTGAQGQTLLLPPEPLQSGDLVRVIARGAGGVSIALNPGQSIDIGGQVYTVASQSVLVVLDPGTFLELTAVGGGTFFVTGLSGSLVAESGQSSLIFVLASFPLPPVVTAPAAVTLGVAASASVPARPGKSYQWSFNPPNGGSSTGPDANGVTDGGVNTFSFTTYAAGPLEVRCVEVNEAGEVGSPGAATVQVYPLPTIDSFTGPASAVSRGAETQLVATFAGTTATIADDAGNVITGVVTQVPVTTAALLTSTTFTLTVTNPAGARAQTATRVLVALGAVAHLSSTLTVVMSIPSVVATPNGRVVLMGYPSTNTANTYDPATATFSATANNSAAAHQGAAFSLLGDGTVLFAGGVDGSSNYGPGTDIFDPKTSSFHPTASHPYSIAASYRGTLANGRAITAGGLTIESGGNDISSIFVWDPISHAWSLDAAASLTQAREVGETCIQPSFQLDDGSLLLATADTRGPSAWVPYSKVELFDFRKTGQQQIRSSTNGVTAGVRLIAAWAKLPDGTILAAGGSNDATNSQTMIDTAELYSPRTNTFTALGAKLSAKKAYTGATTLPDGRVLIAGGYDSAQGVGQSSADVYDPESQQFVAVPGGVSARYAAGAVLLPNGRVLIAGGSNNGSFLSTADVFDPQDDTPQVWSTPPSTPSTLTIPRSGNTATAIGGGRVLIAGGLTAGGGTAVPTEIFDPWARAVLAGPNLVTGRTGHTATRLYDGGVLVAGGVDAGGAVVGAEKYSFAYGQPGTIAQTAGPMAAPRKQHAAVVLPDGRVLVAGGIDSGGSVLATAEIYCVANDQLSASCTQTDSFAAPQGLKQTLLTPRAGHTMTLMGDGRVLIAGGSSAALDGAPDSAHLVASIEVFDWKTNSFSAVAATLAAPRFGHAATLDPQGGVVITGGTGAGGAVLSASERYDENADALDAAPPPPITARTGHQAVLLPWGQILVAGGFDGAGVPLASTQLLAYYDTSTTLGLGIPPASRTFATVGAMGSARGGFGLVLLGNGRVLAAGGTSGAAPVAALEWFK